MKTKFLKMLKKVGISASIIGLGIFSQEAKGQRWDIPPPLPTEKINLFMSPNIIPYDDLNNKTDRDNHIQDGVVNDWISNVSKWIQESYPNGIPPPEYPYWNCANSTMQLTNNSIDFGKKIYGGSGFQDRELLYHENISLEIDSILKHGGSFHNQGQIAAPIYTVALTDPVTLINGHAMNFAITGDNLEDPSSINLIEPQFDMTNVQPGEAYVPRDCNTVMLEYLYVYDNPNGRKELRTISIAFYTIKDGVMKFEGINPHIKDLIITKREKDAPLIEFYKDSEGILHYTIKEENLKIAELFINGNKIMDLKSLEGIINTDNLNGDQNIKITAEDYFRKTGTKDTTINIDGIDPRIYLNNDSDSIKWTIEEEHLKKAWYKINTNTTENIIEQKGQIAIKDMNLPVGLNTITFYATDSSNNTGTENTTINIATRTTNNKESKYFAYPNPVKNHLTLKYPTNTNTTITLQTITGQTLEKIIDNDGDGQTRLDLTNYNPGLYPTTIQYTTPTNNTETTTIKLIKQ